MASNAGTETANAPTALGESPRGPRGTGRGRGRGRGRGNAITDTGSQQPNRRGRGGRRGSFGTSGNESNTMTAADLSRQFASPQNNTAVTPGIEAGEMKIRKVSVAGSEVETEVCFICASPVVHNSLAPCNHRTCHICALRMRALYKTKDCAHCRVSSLSCLYYWPTADMKDKDACTICDIHRRCRKTI